MKLNIVLLDTFEMVKSDSGNSFFLQIIINA